VNAAKHNKLALHQEMSYHVSNPSSSMVILSRGGYRMEYGVDELKYGRRGSDIAILGVTNAIGERV
jgi:hypothetical protein